MIYTPPLSSIKRYVRQGVCISAQGVDGLDLSINEAVSSMQLNDWQESGDDPFLPVHDYDRPLPHGDAYRAVYGYDADARTERVACGAVAYVIKLPDDATSDVACTVQSIAATIVGDRYIADADNETAPYKSGGAIVTAHLSDSPTPPAWSSVLAASGATVCQVVTSEMGVDDKGRPAVVQISPNDRAAVTESTTLSISSSAQKYLCIVVRVADYFYRRGAWYEGGAMLDRASLSITLSRDIAVDALPGGPTKLGWAYPWAMGTKFGYTTTFSGSFFSEVRLPSPFVEKQSDLVYAHDMHPWKGTKVQYDVLAAARCISPCIYLKDFQSSVTDLYFGHKALHWAQEVTERADKYYPVGAYSVPVNKTLGSADWPLATPDNVPAHTAAIIGYPVLLGQSASKVMLGGNITNQHGIRFRIDIYKADLPPFMMIMPEWDDECPGRALEGGARAATMYPLPTDVAPMFSGAGKSIEVVNRQAYKASETGPDGTPVEEVKNRLKTDWPVEYIGGAEFVGDVGSGATIILDKPVKGDGTPWELLMSVYVTDYCATTVPAIDAFPHIDVPIYDWYIQ